MLYVPSKEKTMKRIPFMTKGIESPEYLFSKIEMMSWLKDLPDLGLLSMDLFHCFVFLLTFIIPLNAGGGRGEIFFNSFFLNWSLRVRRMLVQFGI